MSYDAKLIATANAENFAIDVWDVNDANNTVTLSGNENGVASLAFGPTGRQIASGSTDGTVRLWSVLSGQWEQKLLGNHRGWVWAVAFSPDGNRIASGDSSGEVRLWDSSSGRAVGKPLEGHQERVTSLVFSPDSARVASGDDTGAIRTWKIVHGVSVGDALRGREPSVLSATFSPDGMRVVSSRYDRVVQWWNLESSGQTKILSRHTYLALVVSDPGGSVAASIHDETLRLWDMNSGRRLGETGVSASAIAFSEDQTAMVVGDYEGGVRLWDLNSGRVTALEPAHRSSVRRVAVSRDAKLVASDDDSDTRSVRLWEVPTGLYDDLPIDGGQREDLGFTSAGTLMALHRRLSDYALQEYDTGRHVFGAAPGQATVRQKVMDISGRHPQLSPDRRRIVAYLREGAVTLLDLDGRELSRTLVCLDPGASQDGWVAGVSVRWLNDRIIVASCSDRTVVFDSQLERRGEILLLEEGVVAMVDGRGVYAIPGRLRMGVLAFSGSRNGGLGEAVSMRVVRQRLFNQWTFRSRVWSGVTTGWDWVVGVYQSLGKWEFLFWMGVAILCAMSMWLCFPARLAWLSIAGGQNKSFRSERLQFAKQVLDVITLVVWLGRTRRPLRRWLRKYQGMLERECFTEREQVVERARYLPIGQEAFADEFHRRIDRGERGLLWIEGMGGSGKSALAMQLLRNSMIGRRGPIPVVVDEDWQGSSCGSGGASISTSGLDKRSE